MSDQFYQKFRYHGFLPMEHKAVQESLSAPTRFEVLSEAGTRVAFRQSVQSVFTYSDIPQEGCPGKVVTVRTASGDTTHVDGRIFVAWQDGSFGHYLPEHLKVVSEKWANKQANLFDVRKRVASSMDLTDFLKFGSSNDLIHKATRDLWSLQQGKGGVEIVRLFDDTGKPIKA